MRSKPDESFGEDTALRFYAACDIAFHRIAAYPEIGKLSSFRNPCVPRIRVWGVQGFSGHLVFYRLLENRIEIFRVLHGARDLESLFEVEFASE